MKIFFVFLWVGWSLAIEEYGSGQRKFKVSDRLFLERQRDLLRLFQSIYNEDYQIPLNFSIEDTVTNSSHFENFLSLYKQGLLPKGEAFSVFHESHLQQAISLFKLFYYSPDYNTLYKRALWARNNINEGMFIYALSTALAHRPDTFTFIIPPIYELNPYFFFNSEDISKGRKTHLVCGNYSGFYLNLNNEQHTLAYFLEDIGLNAFYYYCNIYYPFWMDGTEFGLKNDRRGEQYYYLYQQFLARYYLERLSNDFGEIEHFNYEDPFKNGYFTSLKYPNGDLFPNRPDNARLTKIYEYTKVQDYERRIRDSVDANFIITKDSQIFKLLPKDETNVLGDLFESNPDSLHLNYYGSWQMHARQLLGYSKHASHSYKNVPSVLEHFETALRDPAFYQLYKRIISIISNYKSYLPSYSFKDLNFANVAIDKIQIDKLFTYFDYFDSDITNAFENNTEKIVIRQQRLNHKPFTYKIFVTSNITEDAVVRVYLGPKFDKHGRIIDINRNRHNFVELETFTFKLQAGKNIIERNSRQMYWYIPDRTTFQDLLKKVEDAIGNTDQLQLDSSEAFYGFPNRLMLPKGKREGQVFQFFVIINEFKAPKRQDVQQEFYFHRTGTGMNYVDDYAFGFPFDRVIVSSKFKIPNALFHDVVIYHKNMEDLM